jgi:POT family proton-dependent oligopeptide transporter
MAEVAEEPMFKGEILGHKSGLFVLFFTEMWERFSFYGMRVLLVNFLTMAVVGYNPGWEWSAENATALFGTYAMLLYITPILGGIIADKLTGYRGAVVVGAILMTAGHAAMAMETEFSLYLGLGLLVLGTGFFKPNMTSILSEMYKKHPKKKDGAFTIFYMGVNAGAFFGMMLCGYLAEKIGWSWGFGLAGVFMLLGTLQFWLAKPLFGKLGDRPVKEVKTVEQLKIEEDAKDATEKKNPFTKLDIVLTIIASIIGLGYALNDPLSKIAGIDVFSFAQAGELEGQYTVVLFGLAVFLVLVISRTLRYEKTIRWKMWAVMIFAFFTVFFWMAFEQGATSLVIFARDNVNRVMTGGAATAFNIVNILLTVVPLLIVSWVLYLLWKNTFKKIPGSNIVLVVCFLGVWGVVGWMLNRDLNSKAYEVQTSYIVTESLDDNGVVEKTEQGEIKYNYEAVSENMVVTADQVVVDSIITINEPVSLVAGEAIFIGAKTSKKDSYGYMDELRLKNSREVGETRNIDNGVVPAKVVKEKGQEVEITVSWFSILNSFFIIALASFFSKWWDSKYNPSAATKYALGLIIMAVGFGFLAFGSFDMQDGVKVSMVWLIFAYLFHTMGELCSSPVGLSYVSKLVPGRMIAFMFGMWYLAIAIGNKLAAQLGGQIESITKEYSLSTFFLIFTIVPFVAGVLIWILNPLLKKLMQEVE